MKRFHVGILVMASAALALLLSACGGLKAPAKLSTASVAELATMAKTSDQYVAGMVAPGGYAPASIGLQALGLAGLQPASGCTGSITGNPTNADGDGYPVGTTTTYSCSFASGGASVTVTGSYSEKDYNDQDPNSGYEGHLKNLKITTTGPSGTSSITVNADWYVTQGSGVYAVKYDLAITLDDNGATLTLKASGDPSYTPTTPAAPYDAGTFTLNGQFGFDDSNGDSYSFTVTSPGLVYDSTCSGNGDFKSGTATYADSGGNVVKLTYQGCGYGSYSYSGSNTGSGTF